MQPLLTPTENKEFLYSGFRLHETGLAPVGTPTFPEWVTVGRFIHDAEKAVQFWIGDWLLYGEKAYGKTDYEEVIAQSGLSYQTLRIYKYVAAALPLSLRRNKPKTPVFGNKKSVLWFLLLLQLYQ